MKKLIKIFSILIFILLTIGITTSKAESIMSNGRYKDAKTLIDYLDHKKTLSISYGDLHGTDSHDNTSPIYCIQHGAILPSGSVSYSKVEDSVYEQLSVKKQRQIAYILLNGDDEQIAGLKKYDKQLALWKVFASVKIDGKDNVNPTLDPDSKAYKLYNKAVAYSEYWEKIEKSFKDTTNGGTNKFKASIITDARTKTEIKDNKVIYGPIQINYPFVSQNKQSFGGFWYKFYNGKKDITAETKDSIKLCKSKDDEEGIGTYQYKEEGDPTSYLVNTGDLNKQDLYIVVDSNNINSISNVTLKVKLRDYGNVTATIAEITGQYEAHGETFYCTSCELKKDNAKNANNLTESDIKEGLTVKYNNKLYIYDGYTTGTTNHNCYNFGGSYESTGVSAPYKCPRDGCTHTAATLDEITNHIKNTHIEQKHYDDWKYHCYICGNDHLDSSQVYGHAHNHAYGKVSFASTIYNFVIYQYQHGTCGKPITGTFKSQRLIIPDAKMEPVTNSYVAGPDIPLNASIKIQKTWVDEGFDEFIPESVQLQIYRKYIDLNGNEQWLVASDVFWGEDFNTLKIDNPSKKNEWVGTISGLARTDSKGNPYFYKIVETTVDQNYSAGYSYSYQIKDLETGINYKRTISGNEIIACPSDSTYGEYEIKNTLTKAPITITKIWDDENNKYGLRPASIELTVYRTISNNNWAASSIWSEVQIENSQISWDTTTYENKWIGTINGLDIKDNEGNKYYYKIVETVDQNYSASYSYTYGSSTIDYIGCTIACPGNNTLNPTITNKIQNGKIIITKQWDDQGNAAGFRTTPTFTIKRSTEIQYLDTDIAETLKEGKDKDYTVKITEKDNNNWEIEITGPGFLVRREDNQPYVYRISENTNENYTPVFKNDANTEEYVDISFVNANNNTIEITKNVELTNKLKTVDIGGCVWLDGDATVKPVKPYDGIKNNGESGLAGIEVYLMDAKNNIVAETKTEDDGKYTFLKIPIGSYKVRFRYDGVHFEDTYTESELIGKGVNTKGETTSSVNGEIKRSDFNYKFKTIAHMFAPNTEPHIYLPYDEKGNPSDGYTATLITKDSNTNKTGESFAMLADTEIKLIENNTDNINLGLIERGTDLGILTDVNEVNVTINGKAATYTRDSENNIVIGQSEKNGAKETYSEHQYNINLPLSDYTYRIRDYVNTVGPGEQNFVRAENTDASEGLESGAVLEIYVPYKVTVSNQSQISKTGNTYVEEINYTYDSRYTFDAKATSDYNDTKGATIGNIEEDGNKLTISGRTKIDEGTAQTFYLVFKLNGLDGSLANINNYQDIVNTVEITKYSTDDGLIDIDSAPGNLNDDDGYHPEDDSDRAGGLTFKFIESKKRVISGKVFDEDEKTNVDDVIVQLIEIAERENPKVKGETRYYEYIWQETRAGSTGENNVRRIKYDASNTVETYTIANGAGEYHFEGYIPGNYIIRFIYGDGSTYDLTPNTIKYNGQDYKSTIDNGYNISLYSGANYTAGASVARDNEARRLETMANYISIDAEKGLLLKLLDLQTVDGFNEVEKQTLIKTYNKYYDQDITEITNEAIAKLLKEQTLANTWMCAETSKIYVGIPDESYTDMNFGLEKRPAAGVKLEKKLSEINITASDGTTLLNAYKDDRGFLEGQQDGLERTEAEVKTIGTHTFTIPGIWRFAVSPTEVKTVVEGAKLEFTYDIEVSNIGEEDYLSSAVITEYIGKSPSEYAEYLKGESKKIKMANKATGYELYYGDDGYNYCIGDYLGGYYTNEGDNSTVVRTEVTDIRDYINNDLMVMSKTNLTEKEDVSHYVLNDQHLLTKVTINQVLDSTNSTGKMTPDRGSQTVYTVTLGQNPISSTGTLEFSSYIAEVMSYTNAAGRRMSGITPGNAEYLDRYICADETHDHSPRIHELDECAVDEIQLGAESGADKNTTYVWLYVATVGIIVVAVGAFVTKKYLLVK